MQLRSLLTMQIGVLGTVDAPANVIVDPTLVRLLVREGISNAVDHGRSNAPIKLIAEVLKDAQPNSPASYSLHISIINFKKVASSRLTAAECKNLFNRKKETAQSCSSLTRR